MDSWARMARPACSVCGHKPLGWTRAAHLLLILDDLEDRKRVTDLIALVGNDADAWKCEACGAWGIFGPTEVSLPSRRVRRSRAFRARSGR